MLAQIIRACYLSGGAQFLNPKILSTLPDTMRTVENDPHAHPEPAAGETTVVFDDHRFCSGRMLEIAVMSAPHRHSQFEINHILTGSLTYWFDGREVRIEAGRTALFWGMAPHQSIAHDPGATFVCLYIPAEIFVSLNVGDALRTALFRGDLVEFARPLESDGVNFRGWREDLLREDPELEAIVRDELTARLRRVDRDGWRELRRAAAPSMRGAHREAAGAEKAAAMARFIGERSSEDLDVGTIAREVGLHPNYAMTLFRKALGLTINQYLTRARLDTAQSLLASTEDEIASIAFASGFGSLSRFYLAFEQRFDMSPGAFRRLRQGNAR